MTINLNHSQNQISSDNQVITISSTGALTLPVGTTPNRPLTPAMGMSRVSSTTGKLEYYNGTVWQIVVSNLTGSVDDLIPPMIAMQTM